MYPRPPGIDHLEMELARKNNYLAGMEAAGLSFRLSPANLLAWFRNHKVKKHSTQVAS
jgi:hypothetical protein